MKQTPLADVHLKLGAKMVEFGGWNMPVQYGPILDEVTTVRTKVGLFDLSHMGRVRVTGAEREKFLEKIATNFVGKIPMGAIRYSLFCRADGNPIVDLDWMREHARGMQVKIEDQTDELAMIALQGQLSQTVLQEMTRDLDL